jgi:transcriptional regulator with XRE-family HTH domain
MNPTLGERVLRSRTERGWSLADVASRTGLSRAYINAIERGRSKRPGADALGRLEAALGPLTTERVSLGAVPPGLAAIADERQIPQAELVVLAGLRVQGRQPQSRERWRFIYDALVASEGLDRRRDEEGGP